MHGSYGCFLRRKLETARHVGLCRRPLETPQPRSGTCLSGPAAHRSLECVFHIPCFLMAGPWSAPTASVATPNPPTRTFSLHVLRQLRRRECEPLPENSDPASVSTWSQPPHWNHAAIGRSNERAPRAELLGR